MEGDGLAAKLKACYFDVLRLWVFYVSAQTLYLHGVQAAGHTACTPPGKNELSMQTAGAGPTLLHVRLSGKAPTSPFLPRSSHTCECARLLWENWRTECVLGLRWMSLTASPRGSLLCTEPDSSATVATTPLFARLGLSQMMFPRSA